MQSPGAGRESPSWANFWELSNRPRPFSRPGMRVGCWVLFGVYTAITLTMHEAAHPEFLVPRGAICLHALAGVWLAGRGVTWRGLRAYTVILALLMPLAAAFVGATHGNAGTDLALTALATFVALAWVQTGVDLAIVAAGLLVGHGLILHGTPHGMDHRAMLAIFLGGGTAAGAFIAFYQALYRAELQESMGWWREACERERTLREFAEAMASHRDASTLPDRLASLFAAAFRGRCALVTTAPGAQFETVATAGFTPEQDAAMRAAPIVSPVAGLLADVVRRREPSVNGSLTDADRADLGARCTYPVTARCIVALPMTMDGAVGAIALLSDVTPRTISPDDLALWSAMAHQAGIAFANARLVARLERALRAKSEFLNTMSHELRSPLHVVVGYAEMLREEATEPGQSDLAVRIRGSALDLLSIVEETMSASRLEAGRLHVRADRFEPSEVVRELSEAARALPEAQRQVTLHWDVAPGLPVVSLDRLKVKEIVQNLVSNALKFTEQGEVRVQVTQHDGRLRITVRDTGVGIAPEAQARIFEMFERVETDTGPRPPGAGLGLYIVQRLVELMGGTIELESAPGTGSTFTVALPLALDRAA